MPPRGQTWTTLEALAQSHMNAFREHEPGVIGIGASRISPSASARILVRTPGGNVLWDCIAHARRRDRHADQGPRRPQGDRDLASAFLHDDGGVEPRLRLPDPSARRRQRLGHAAGPGDQFWDGETLQLWDGVTLVRCGGHFPGGTVLHWQGGADGKGIVCSGDILTVADRPQMAVLHAQLSEFHSAVGARGRGHRPRDGAVRVRRASTAIISTASSPRTRKRCWKNPSRGISRRWRGRGGIELSPVRPRESGDPAVSHGPGFPLSRE